MTVATLTNRAVTAILRASSNQNRNSGDTKCILRQGGNSGGNLDTTVVHHSKSHAATSGMGQKRTWRSENAMSALPPKADIGSTFQDVRFVPIADIGETFTQCRKHSKAVGTTNQRLRLIPVTCRFLGRQSSGCRTDSGT